MYTITAQSGASRTVLPTRGWFSFQDAIRELLGVDAEELAALVLLPDEYETPETCPGLLTSRAKGAGLVTIKWVEDALPCEGRRRRRPPLDSA